MNAAILVGAELELILEPAESAHAVGTRGGRNRDAAHEQRTEDAVEQVDAADPDCTEGVAVVRVAETKEPLLAWPPDQLPILERLLQRDLDRGRAGVRVEHPRQAGRRHFD